MILEIPPPPRQNGHSVQFNVQVFQNVNYVHDFKYTLTKIPKSIYIYIYAEHFFDSGAMIYIYNNYILIYLLSRPFIMTLTTIDR